MRVLVYKRTHNGDPDASGCFGANDCMGTARDREYDAVVGVGGIGPEAVSNGIDGQVNWIGIGPHKRYVDDKRGPEVMFDHFRSYGTGGPDFLELAPVLAKRMYTYNIRSILGGLSDAELAEAVAIVQRATDSPASPRLATAWRVTRAVTACSTLTPDQMVCCQGVIFDALAGSNAVRPLSTPWAIMSSFRRPAPTAAIFGLPAATSRP